MAGRDVGANMFSKLMKDFLRGPGTKPAGADAADFGATAFLTAGGRDAEHYTLQPEEVENALSNFKSGDNEATLGRFGEGARFAGVYNPANDRFLAYPSGDTLLLDGGVPANRVPRNLGHLRVNNVLSKTLNVDPTRNLGFTATLKGGGSFGMKWLSRSVNELNPTFEGNQVPYLPIDRITTIFAQATGRAVKSET
jgi:hypothetical protein